MLLRRVAWIIGLGRGVSVRNRRIFGWCVLDGQQFHQNRIRSRRGNGRKRGIEGLKSSYTNPMETGHGEWVELGLWIWKCRGEDFDAQNSKRVAIRATSSLRVHPSEISSLARICYTFPTNSQFNHSWNSKQNKSDRIWNLWLIIMNNRFCERMVF